MNQKNTTKGYVELFKVSDKTARNDLKDLEKKNTFTLSAPKKQEYIKMKLVLLDTNFLMIPYKFGIDIFGEIEKLVEEKYEAVTLSTVVDELKRIKRGEDKIAARVALKLIEDNDVRVIESSGVVDSAIIDFAENNDAIICTNDAKLRRYLQKNGVKTIYMRQKSRLERG